MRTRLAATKAREELDAVVDRILDADGNESGRGGSGRLRDRSRERRGN